MLIVPFFDVIFNMSTIGISVQITLTKGFIEFFNTSIKESNSIYFFVSFNKFSSLYSLPNKKRSVLGITSTPKRIFYVLLSILDLATMNNSRQLYDCKLTRINTMDSINLSTNFAKFPHCG